MYAQRLLMPLLLLPVALAVNASPSARIEPEKVGILSAKLERIEEVVRRHMLPGEAAGAVVLVARDGRIAYLKAIGTDAADSRKPLKTDAVFWVASLTKPIVAASVMMMVEEGKVALDDPVSKFIPTFKAPGHVRVLRPGSPPPQAAYLAWGPLRDPSSPRPQYDLVRATRAITVKDLLTHTSGLGPIGIYNESVPIPQEGETVGDWVPKLAQVPLDFQPGTGWAYSNATGFDILVRIVEVASGQSFDRFVQQRLFDPLHMKSTGFLGKRQDLMARVVPAPGNFARLPCVKGTVFFCGSGGMWSTAEDYMRFAQMLLDQGRAPDGERLLKPETVALMASDQAGDLFPDYQGIATKGADLGLNLLVINDPVAAGVAVPAGSFGWDGMGTRRFWIMPKLGIVLVMMIPAPAAAGPPIHRDIEKAVIDALAK